MKYKTILVIDHVATGQVWRERRKDLKISLRQVASRMGLSAPFVSDLERGRRNWTEGLEQKFQNALEVLNSFDCLGNWAINCKKEDCDFSELCIETLNIDIEGVIVIVEETE